MAWIYLGVVIAGHLSGRTILVGIQTGLAGNRTLLTIVGAVAGLFLISLLVWGFRALDWYWPVIAFVAGALLAWFTIRPANLAAWYGASTLLYTATAIGGLYLWLWNWPF